MSLPASPGEELWRTRPPFSASDGPLSWPPTPRFPAGRGGWRRGPAGRHRGRAVARQQSGGGLVRVVVGDPARVHRRLPPSRWRPAPLGQRRLMAIFFLVVGMEIKYEWSTAICATRARRPCRSRRRSAAWSPRQRSTPRSTPAAQAPRDGACRWRPTSPSRSGCWRCSAGAFRLRRGLLAHLRHRRQHRCDSVIAIFYTQNLALDWLAVAGAGVVAVLMLRALRVWSVPAYLAGRCRGVAGDVPVRSPRHHRGGGAGPDHTGAPAARQDRSVRCYATVAVPSTLERCGATTGSSSANRCRSRALAATPPPVEQLRRASDLRTRQRRDRSTQWSTQQRVSLTRDRRGGLGLVVGKIIGIAATSWLVVRLKLGRLPPGVGWTPSSAGALGGIGFTGRCSSGLAFPVRWTWQPTRRSASSSARPVGRGGGLALLWVACRSASSWWHHAPATSPAPVDPVLTWVRAILP